MLFQRLYQGLACGFLLGSLVSCGGGSGTQIVKGLKVETSVVDDQLHLRVSSEIDFANIMMPSLQIPIIKDGEAIGTVSMVPVLGSKTQFVVDVNVAELQDLPSAGTVTLPNGTLAPLIGTNPAVAVNLGKGAQLYVAAASNAYALGVAIPISGLDSVGQSLGGLNFFPMFALDKTVGAAGIFASREPGKSGFGFFVDVTPYLQGMDWGLPTSSNAAIAMGQELMQQESAEIELDYRQQQPAKAKLQQLQAKLYDMNRRRVQLKR